MVYFGIINIKTYVSHSAVLCVFDVIIDPRIFGLFLVPCTFVKPEEILSLAHLLPNEDISLQTVMDSCFILICCSVIQEEYRNLM